MLKRVELSDPNSCLNRARDDELLFVLLGRDLDTPDTIMEWIAKRIRRGKNKPGDAQIQEAFQIARTLAGERPVHLAREVSLQELSDCGINPFAVELLQRSYSQIPAPVPVTFLFQGVRFSLSMETS
jgi:hypothetical protein